ncbi:hypothetical protein SVAN01_02907 [Stagonosporopsis vannaccii]|nr:hypothetical protein SVAN01_02907 [Stagonosporopsis vannaccii]
MIGLRPSTGIASLEFVGFTPFTSQCRVARVAVDSTELRGWGKALDRNAGIERMTNLGLNIADICSSFDVWHNAPATVTQHSDLGSGSIMTGGSIAFDSSTRSSAAQLSRDLLLTTSQSTDHTAPSLIYAEASSEVSPFIQTDLVPWHA